MDSLWPTLVQFLLRLSFGLALAMSITPAAWVTSGYFRVHLWVVMGLATFASLGVYSNWSWYTEHSWCGATWPFAFAISLALTSYVGAVTWIYEQARLGKAALIATALLALAAGGSAFSSHTTGSLHQTFTALNWLSSGITLGTFLAAMFLGHWYLNWPGMKLEPLRRLVLISGGSLALRAILSGVGIYYALAYSGVESFSSLVGIMLVFRWLTGIIGPAVMAYLTWQTLKIPNTQSATGILYAAVILIFLGELTSQLLSRSLVIPL